MKKLLVLAACIVSTTHAAQQARVEALFPKTIEQVHEQVLQARIIAQTGLANFLAVPAIERTFENTARAYDQLSLAYRNAVGPLGLLQKVSPDPELRAACQQALLELSSFSVDFFMTPQVYDAFKGYTRYRALDEELSSEQVRYVGQMLRGLESAGFALPEEELSYIKALKKELSALSMQFANNISASTGTIACTRVELAGTRDNLINALPQDQTGRYLLGTDYPTYGEVMGHCTVASTRQAMYRMFQNRAYPSNIPVLEAVIAKRHELALALGYNSYAEMNLTGEMVETPKRAHEFIAQLQEKALPYVKGDFEKLTEELPEGVALDEDGKLSPWDVTYAAIHYAKKKRDLDPRKVAEYFPMEHTVGGLLDIYQEFFSLTFRYSKPENLWHPDVMRIDVYETGATQVIGHILLDLHPRPGKYTHACHVGLVPGLAGSSSPSVGCVIANFPASTIREPSLLKHSDVKTFFHEFGHAVHHVLGRTELAGFAGTSTATDFVEMPSQMFEQWLFDREVLKKISSHYQTGDPLPDDILDKLLEGGSSAGYVRGQCSLALFSLACYEAGASKDTVQLWHNIKGGNAPYIAFDPEDHFPAAFGHLMGYGAGYYGYLWSKVIAHDCFEKVKAGGLLNPEMGKEVRDKILSKGGSLDANELVESFLGRPVTQDAFLADLGLA